MKITYLFYTLKDFSKLEKGQQLIDKLISYEMQIEKIGAYEPVKLEPSKENFEKLWTGWQGENGFSEGGLLFKGSKGLRFMGMADWCKNLPHNSIVVNGLHLFLTVPKKFDIRRIKDLGDDLFEWSEAEYGYITEDSREMIDENSGNIYSGIPALLWVNYFGPSYLAEPDFHLPESAIKMHHGARLDISETPNDDKLINQDHLNIMKEFIGVEWFWDYPKKHMRKIPKFDASEITRASNE